ncbi:hypothetical protein [Denitrobaculum tricleocarpae]|uniref:Uncharacterized protein n=1 Tax=Denitrobaculum tricleocarpae TaxID=2591009 RepID=A0A545TU77_9PROT|nr:hypothetical protein [Denitrobaculum tricleocarpae]TQV80770.1 hypothetical protein FKG95_11505 [Denitrobaculum tricleocarpae]
MGPEAFLISAAVGALGAIQEARASSAASEFNAKIADNNAIIAEQNAAADETRQRRAAGRQAAASRAAIGAAGVTLEGSPMEVLEDQALEAELDALNIRYGGRLQASNYRSQAQLDRSAARSARTQGFLSAGSTLLRGAAQFGEA